MSSLPPARDGGNPPSGPASWRAPAPDEIPPLPPLIADEVWQPEEPLGLPPPSHYRITDEEDVWWNGWEWRWDKPGALLGQIPWPFVIRPATVDWARRLCMLQGAVQIVVGVAASYVLARNSLQSASFSDRDKATAVELADLLGIGGFTMFFGNALLRISRGVRALITTVEIIDAVAATFIVQSGNLLLGYAGGAAALLILSLLWLDPATRFGFKMLGKEVAGPTGPIIMKVVPPRRLRGQIPAYPPAAPLHPPPPRPQRYR